MPLRSFSPVPVSLCSDNLNLWCKHDQREREIVQLLLQVLPALPNDNIIHNHREARLEERASQQTHIFEAQTKLPRRLSIRFTCLTDPHSPRDDHLLKRIGLNMYAACKALRQ